MFEDSVHQPYWHSKIKPSPEYPPLDAGLKCDVAIVGAGITGLTAAINLRIANLNVVLIEMNSIANSATALSTGHLDNYYDRQFSVLIRHYGPDTAKHIIHAKKKAIDTIRKIGAAYDLDCDFSTVPAYLYCENDKDVGLLEREKVAADKINIDCSLTDKIPLPFTAKKSLMFNSQARISPYAYAVRLADAFVNAGGKIFEHTPMKNFKQMDSRVLIRTPNADIDAGNLLLCGHTALTGRLSIQTRIYPMLSFAIAVEVQDYIQDALFWDTDVPYHYTRIASSDNPFLLIIGGADCHAGTTEDTNFYYESLYKYAADRYQIKSVPYYWCNEFFEPVDALPYAGLVPFSKNVFVAGAYSGDGLTLGTMSANLLCDLILKIQNPLEDILSPSRFKPVVSIPNLTKMVGNATKHLVVDRMTARQNDIDGLMPDSGAVMKVNNKTAAVYRDSQGLLHAFSASCRHMGCIVRWNSAERTWDCPCHGGRYDCLGNVITGPPRDSLKKIDILAHVEH